MRRRGPFCALIEMGPGPHSEANQRLTKIKTLSQFGRLMNPVI